MDPATLAALRNYSTTKRNLTPENLTAQANKASPAAEETKQPEGIAKAASEFAEVFTNAEETAKAMSVGKADPHSVVQALATAEVALETAVTVRDKVVEAYQEILRMPV